MTQYSPNTYGVTAALDVTPSDTITDATIILSTTAVAHPFPRAIMVTADGTVKMRLSGGDDITVTLIAGQIYPFQFSQIYATGTTATGIKALF